jgi:large subunit ribosomal protein L23
VEQAYKVKVKNVNTFVSAGKLKRVRHQLGRTSDTKKAVVTLAAGQKIEVQ